ncbi:hypothetical protein [Streptosporangium canum]|uniref:hypothetical protein n=1 Tax=Streptosporangium canum TaxID=324952 RepID=UPI0037B1BDA3
MYKLNGALGAGGAGPALLSVSTAVSFVVTHAFIAWLLRHVGRHYFDAFVSYRIIIGALLLALLGTEVLTA